MKTVVALLLLLAASAAQARAQDATRPPGGARLYDQFGDIRYSDLMAHLDNFAIELQNDEALRGVVVAYAARHKFPGWPMRRGRTAVDYLVNERGLEAARLSVVNGGLRGETSFDLWVVPAGAGLPFEPFDASLLMAGERSPLLFDRFAVVEQGDDDVLSAYGLEPHPDSAGVYEYFAEVLRRDPSLRGCVIAYTWRRGARAADWRIAARAKTTIAKAHAIDVARVVALGGGRREHKMIELWLVPPGAPLPPPTPEPRRPRRRRR